MSGLAIAFTLLLQQPAPAGDVVDVVVSTRDCNVVRGTAILGELKIEGSLGTVDLKVADLIQIEFVDGVAAYSRDGSIIRGKMKFDSVTVKSKVGEFTIKRADLATIVINGVVAPPTPQPTPTKGPKNPIPIGPLPDATPSPSPKPSPTPPPTLQPTKSLILNASVPRILRSTDGKTLYALDATEGKLLAIDLATLEKTGEAAVVEGAFTMSMDPAGEAIFVAAKKAITIIAPGTMAPVKTIAVEQDIHDILAVDKEHALAIGNDTHGIIVVYSMAKQAQIHKVEAGYGANAPILRSPDGRRAYLSGGFLMLPEKGKGFDSMGWFGFQGGQNLGSEFVFSPDGRYVVSTNGTVFRMGRSQVADAIAFSKVLPHLSCTFSEDLKRLLVFTREGFLKEYDGQTFDLKRSTLLGLPVEAAFMHRDGESMTVFAAAKVDDHNRHGDPKTVGNFYRFPLPK